MAVDEEDASCKGALLSLAFERIILDEAHEIRYVYSWKSSIK